MEEFTLVKPKYNKKYELLKYELSFNDTIEIIKNILIENNIFSAFLFGSYARGQKSFNDIDILIICKKYISYNFIEIKKKINNKLNYPIDLCGMIYMGKLINYNNNYKSFIEDNVYVDAISIFEHNKYIILESDYIGKI
jgi:predicted nucleotidyltransferase